MLRVDSLALAYGATPSLEGVSHEVPSGKVVRLVGPSGSGKSSLLRAVIGLQKPLAGIIETDIGASEIGMLFQDDALLPWRTAEQNVALGLR
ncbi:MAG: ATP-binding cassette domain-containing protein, partial [Stellaceae bacterium]